MIMPIVLSIEVLNQTELVAKKAGGFVAGIGMVTARHALRQKVITQASYINYVVQITISMVKNVCKSSYQLSRKIFGDAHQPHLLTADVLYCDNRRCLRKYGRD